MVFQQCFKNRAKYYIRIVKHDNNVTLKNVIAYSLPEKANISESIAKIMRRKNKT